MKEASPSLVKRAGLAPKATAATTYSVASKIPIRLANDLRGISRSHHFWVKVAAILCTVFAGLSTGQNASAVILDWDSVTWSPGSLANSYDIDLGTTGSDINISMTGNTNTFTTDSNTGVMTPAITQTLEGGFSPVENSLQLAANLKTNSDIYVNVSFSNQYFLGVSYVSFTIFDIDEQTNNDRISGIYGIALDGTQIAATITNVGSAVSLTGSGLTQVLSGVNPSADTGATSSDGNATISFGATAITGFVFDYNNTNGAPRYQHIAISDLGFIPIPEISPAIPAFLLCAVATLFKSQSGRRRTHSA
jgi:hypothetical protein